MDSDQMVDVGYLEGRTYIIGRDGHIYIDSPTVSKLHAELRIINGRIYLKDLNSTNGTYLLKNNRLVYFEEGFVSLLQPIAIGDERYTVQNLLEIAGDFTFIEDITEQINLVEKTSEIMIKNYS
jgi:pSer/pThr/pTyr-binding forkhead associated (FHA) protein